MFFVDARRKIAFRDEGKCYFCVNVRIDANIVGLSNETKNFSILFLFFITDLYQDSFPKHVRCCSAK